MDIECAKRGDVVVLGPKGSLNTETAPKFEQKLLELLNAAEKRFLIDFARVDYISSAGLRVLLMAAKRLKAGGGAIVLCAMSPPVKKVFALCGFERDFTIVESRDRALERLLLASPSIPQVAPVSDAVRRARPPAAAPVAPEPVAMPQAAPPPDRDAAPGASSYPADAAFLAMALRALATGLGTRGEAMSPAKVAPALVDRATRALALAGRGGRESQD